MAFIPEEIIRQVLDRSDIVEVVASYVPLKAAGRNFKACCPFHNEKTPSFIVNPAKQIFHCFGCGVGGNVITFVMSQERLEFPDAVRLLAGKVGVAIPAPDEKGERTTHLRQQLRRVNELAAAYFHHNLLSDKGPQAGAARRYLKDRQVDLAMVKRFQIGFALDQWDGLIQFLRKKDVTLKLMERAGLVVPQQRGEGYYDRFRNRIIFPIFDVNAKCVAFGARTMDPDNPAKYVNSPETPIYTKGNHLYGFHLAKETVGRQDEAIVVEGYMDFMTPYQAGAQNIVASLGTALTEAQIRLLRRFTKNVIMLFDSDPAGESAMIRSLDLLIEEGMSVRVALLTEDDDPDSFVRKQGIDKFLERIQQAESLFDFKLKFLTARYGLRTVESRAQISAEMLTTIDKFKNEIIRTEYIKQLAGRLALSEGALLSELGKVAGRSPARRAAAGTGPRAATSEVVRPVERDLLGLMLTDQAYIPMIRQEVDLSDFQNKWVRDIVAKIYELFEQGRDASLSGLMSRFDDQKILKIISGLLASEDLLIGDKKRIHRDCIQRLKQERLRGQRRDILRQMEQARDVEDHQELERLTKAFNLLIKG